MLQFLLQGKAGEHAGVLQGYRRKADFFACSCLGKDAADNVGRTPGGMLYQQRWNNIQFVTSASFLLAVYSDHLAGGAVRCSGGGGAVAGAAELLAFAKSQVDYILGSNPRGTSYMVGYGAVYPRQAHHRGSSIASIRASPSFVSCREGYASWYGRRGGNPNLLDGAVVGGPDEHDDFADERNNYEQTEAATYNNAPLMGILARLAAGHGARARGRLGQSLQHGIHRSILLGTYYYFFYRNDCNQKSSFDQMHLCLYAGIAANHTSLPHGNCSTLLLHLITELFTELFAEI